MSICLQYDKNGNEIYFEIRGGKKKRIAKSKVGNRDIIPCEGSTNPLRSKSTVKSTIKAKASVTTQRKPQKSKRQNKICKRLDEQGELAYTDENHPGQNKWCPKMDPRKLTIKGLLPQRQSEEPLFLHGPVSLYYMKHPDIPHKIYLLGDYHFKLPKNTCPYSISVDDWIYNIVESGMELDLYLEVYYSTKDKSLADTENNIRGEQPNYMQDVRLRFDTQCFHHNKSDCNVGNTRIHYVDFRSINSNTAAKAWFLRSTLGHDFGTDHSFEVLWLLRTLKDNSGSSYSKIRIANIKDILKFNLKMLQKLMFPLKMYELIYNQFTIDKIIKQIANFPPEREYMGDIIMERLRKIEEEFIAHAPKITGQQYTDLYEFIYSNNTNSEYFSEVLKPFTTAARYYMISSHFYGDIYLVARFLREYSDARPSYNSIAFMGDGHIEYIRALLIELGFYTDYEDFNGGKCLDISELNLFE